VARNAAGAWLCAALLVHAAAAFSQDTGPVHAAPYIPSPPSTVDEMLRLAEVGPGDTVYDLGAGDGRVVIAAARKFGARGVGVEIDAALVERARANAARAGVADRVRFVQRDLFRTNLGEATVIALYLAPNMNLKLRPALLGLKAGTRIVSHAADLGDWRPDRRTVIRKEVLLWVVPARVAGRWRAQIGVPPRPLELDFTQRYQELSASARLASAPVQVWEARLDSDRLSFVLVDGLDKDDEANLYFEGRVTPSAIEGTVTRGVGAARTSRHWRAERLAP
jgi:SAM-dependent methyltransferase